MIVVGSVRPGRVGLPIARWVRSVAQTDADRVIDFADLAELALPFMDEPNHPMKQQYTKQHTIDWAARVDAADAFIFVSPEYNHSFSPALKNAIDFVSVEWSRKPVGVVSYGGISAGTRGVTALEPVLVAVGLVRASAEVEISAVATHVVDGVFTPSERHQALLEKQLTELDVLAGALSALR